jgi:nicotinic acid mononucleotide adenylyltransferase
LRRVGLLIRFCGAFDPIHVGSSAGKRVGW